MKEKNKRNGRNALVIVDEVGKKGRPPQEKNLQCAGGGSSRVCRCDWFGAGAAHGMRIATGQSEELLMTTVERGNREAGENTLNAASHSRPLGSRGEWTLSAYPDTHSEDGEW